MSKDICRFFIASFWSHVIHWYTLPVLWKYWIHSVYILKCGEFVVLPSVVLCYVNSDYMNGRNNEKKTTGKMDWWGLKSSVFIGNKILPYCDQREEGMEGHAIGRVGPQRNVVLDKKIKKKWMKKKKKKAKKRRRRCRTCWRTKYLRLYLYIYVQGPMVRFCHAN